ncbi:MAG: M3 family metallopeptidase, partial [Rhodospirillaceae bacterium]
MPEARDGAALSSGSDLPEWDLSDLYDGPESEALAEDIAVTEDGAKAFREAYLEKVAALEPAAFGAAIQEYERLSETLYKFMSYAQLLHAGDVSDPEIGRFYQSMHERGTVISSLMLFFTLEINTLDDAVLEAKMVDPVAGRYTPWIRDLRLFRAHQLTDEMERLLNEKEVAGRSAWMRLFDETIADLRFSIPGKGDALTMTEALDQFSSPKPEERQVAAEAVAKGLKGKLSLFSRVTNTLAKDKQIEDTWRNYDHPMASRNLSNQVEDDVVDALVGAVKDSFPRLSHRYYSLKAKWFGMPTLNFWDRNAPLPDGDDKRYSWSEATETVLGAYGAFSPDLAKVGKRFFDNAWIDVPVRPGKSPGAFAHPTVPSAHPYLLLNFMGRTRDVMTLAHELGHGCHQVLAAGQGALLADTPLTLAETASVFGEMLT